MINTFVVNFRDNDDVALANKLQVVLGEAMNIYVGTHASRIPLMIMQSGLDAKTHGEGLRVFKERAGLRMDDTDMNVLVNTCMNPWQMNESITEIGELFRMIVFNCLGRLRDSVESHRFILSGAFDDYTMDNSIFIEYLTSTDIPERQYQASVKVELDSKADRKLLIKYINSCREKNLPVLFETVAPRFNNSDENVPNLYSILHLKDWGHEITVKLISDDEGHLISFKVLDIPRFQCLDMSSTVTYPEEQKYFIYGDASRVIMSHVISKLPDFQHTVTLNERPQSLTGIMQDLGVMADVKGVAGSPLEISGEMTQPLQKTSYEISFTGELKATIFTTINIKETVVFNPVLPQKA
jgi:hypothetical protein